MCLALLLLSATLFVCLSQSAVCTCCSGFIEFHKLLGIRDRLTCIVSHGHMKSFGTVYGVHNVFFINHTHYRQHRPLLSGNCTLYDCNVSMTLQDQATSFHFQKIPSSILYVKGVGSVRNKDSRKIHFRNILGMYCETYFACVPLC